MNLLDAREGQPRDQSASAYLMSPPASTAYLLAPEPLPEDGAALPEAAPSSGDEEEPMRPQRRSSTESMERRRQMRQRLQSNASDHQQTGKQETSERSVGAFNFQFAPQRIQCHKKAQSGEKFISQMLLSCSMPTHRCHSKPPLISQDAA